MKILKSFPISKLTTFRMGGIAKYFIQVSTKKDLVDAAAFAKKNTLQILVLGEGSNVLASDKEFSGLIIQPTNKNIELKDGFVASGAGVKWDDLVEFCVKRGFYGIECLSGIPGTVGAAPFQNIGAYGQELKDSFIELTAYDKTKEEFVVFNKSECKFGYRDSIFKNPKYKNRYIIFEVKLKLSKTGNSEINYDSLKSYLLEKNIENPSLSEIRNAVLTIRSRKLEDPKKIGNAGSFFKNPFVNSEELEKLKESYPDIPNFPAGGGKTKLFAGWLVDKAGWKGYKYKNVGVSAKNALVLVNQSGKGKADEISELAENIRRDVYKKFKVELEPEVQYINF